MKHRVAVLIGFVCGVAGAFFGMVEGAAPSDRTVASVTVRLVLLNDPSTVELTADLESLGTPVTHQSQLIPGRTVYLEAWCQTPGPAPISTAVVDLTYDTTIFDTTVAQVALASQWGLLPFPVGVDDALGRVDDLGGNNIDEVLGLAPEWAKIGTVALDVLQTPFDRFTLCSEFAGDHLTFALLGEGTVPAADVDYTCLTVGCLLNVDCDDGSFCNGNESCDASLGCQSGEPPCADPVFPQCDDAANQCVACLAVGDVNGDAAFDLADVGQLSECLTSPVEGAASPPLYGIECQCLDTNDDGDVDLMDYAELQTLFAP